MSPPTRHGDAAAGFVLGPLVAADAAGGTALRVLSGGWLRAAHGRWLQLRLAPAQAAPQLRVVLHSARADWPTLSQPLREEAGEAQAWIFLAPAVRGVSLQGPEAALATLRWLGATLHAAPPGPEAAQPAMHGAAQLHALGVRGLHGVTFTDDPAWPLQAGAPGARLRLQGGGTAGALQVRARLRREAQDGAAPALCWGEGPGRQRRPLEGGPLLWQAELPALDDGAGWELEPLAQPGRFALDGLDTQPCPPALHPVQRALKAGRQWLQALQLRHGRDVLQPVHELRRLPQPPQRPPAFHASGHDPYFRMTRPLAAGWYMVELALELPCVRHRARLYLDDGTGERESAAWSLPLRTGRVAKRLLWVRTRSTLRLDPMSMPGDFTLLHFRLQRVSSGFARSRMLRKLRAEQQAQAPAFEAAALQALWRGYCQGFEPHHHGSISYDEWISQVEQPGLPGTAQQLQALQGWAWRPLISILTPARDTAPALLRECLDSVLAQGYPHWQLCVADADDADPALQSLLREYAARDARIRLAPNGRGGDGAEADNAALAAATGELVALLDAEDRLAPHALFALAQALQQRPQALLAYSDEDRLDAQGRRCDPRFKPGWSPDLLRSQHYVSRLVAYRAALVRAVGGFRRGFEGHQDYDLLLRCAERVRDPADVLHVPQVLYHRRRPAGAPATAGALRALQAHAERLGGGVQVSALAPGLFRARWPVPEPAPLVSLIIPTRDALEVLRPCVESIVHGTLYPHYELLLVDNQSRDPATLAWLQALPQRLGAQRVRVLRWDAPFNYSAINNFAAAQARGSVLGLVNNDVEVIAPEWLGEMVAHAVRPEVGCVGAKLYYPDDTIQHAGVVLGLGGVAGHGHAHFARDAEGYCSRLRAVHNVSAVTGAVLLLRKAVFEEVGGLDAEQLPVSFNDVDLCLKARAAGYFNVWTPFAELYHHESKTRRAEASPQQQQRLARERAVMLQRWRIGATRDPFYNPNLSLARADFSVALQQGERCGAAPAIAPAARPPIESSQ